MVKIKKGNPRNRVVLGSQKNSSSSLFSVRNLIVFLVVAQGFRIMTQKDFTINIPSESLEDHGIKGQLGTFKGESNNHLRTPSKKEMEQPSDEEDDDDRDEKTDDDEIEDKERTADDDKKEDSGETEEEDTDKDNSAGALGDLNPIVVNKKGTGPTDVGYVKDFVHERANPPYKTMGTPSIDHSSEIAKMVNAKSVLPCVDEKTGTRNPKCSDHDTALVAFNSEPFVRTWCGKEIQPEKAVVMTEHCDDPIAHMFPVDAPPTKGEHMPSVVIKTADDKQATKELVLEHVDCDVPCEQQKGIRFGANERSGKQFLIDGTPWKIKMEAKKMDRTDYKNDQYYSSQSLLSSVPLTHYDPELHSFHNRPAVDFDAAEEKAIYMVNNDCGAKLTKRRGWFNAVNEKVGVDSFGKCDHNADVPEGMTIDTFEGRLALAKKYRIILALDNDNTKDHISNVVWEAFLSGAVPVVSGAENIANRFPPKSFINVNMFDDYRALGDHVKKVISDKELWLSYQTWRTDEAEIEKVEKENQFGKSEPTCRLCRWAYAKKYGLGWDHTKQELRPIPRVPKDKFCTTADHALVSKPFSEVWVTKGDDELVVLEEGSDDESCSSLRTDGGLSIGSVQIHRMVFHHDGVTDIFITESTGGAESALRLKFPGIRNTEGACFLNTHSLVSTTKGAGVSSASIQDDLVKITILANWDTTVHCLEEGVMEVKNDSKPLSETGAPRRVRVIIEELNPIFDKMTEFAPSSFCELMTKDFIEPVGVYFVDS